MNIKPSLSIIVDEYTLVLFPSNLSSYFDWDKYCESMVNKFLRLSNYEQIFGTFELAKSKIQAGYNTGLTVTNRPFHIGIYWHDDNPNMGICVKVSATALHFYEVSFEELNGLKMNLYVFIKTIQCPDLYTTRFSRLDFVADYYNYPSRVYNTKFLSPDELYSDIKKNDIRIVDCKDQSRIKTMRGIENGGACETFYIGSTGSGNNGFLRVYDKKIEQISTHGSYYKKAINLGSWLRCEAVFKNKFAHGLTEQILQIDNDDDFLALIATHISNKYRFFGVQENDYLKITSDLIDVANQAVIPTLSYEKPVDNSLEQSILNLYSCSGLMSILYKIDCIYGKKGINAFLDNIIEYYENKYSVYKHDKRPVLHWLKLHGAEYRRKRLIDVFEKYPL